MTEMVRYKHLFTFQKAASLNINKGLETFQEAASLNINKGLESEKSLHPNGATVRSGK
jgi:hypothetical protein